MLYDGLVISAQRQLQLEGAMEATRQKRAAVVQRAQGMQDSATSHAQGKEMAQLKPGPGGKALTGKPKAKAAGSKSNKAASSKRGTNTVNTASITPYLTAGDLMDTSNAVANAENTVSDSRLGVARAGFEGLQAAGDVERGRVANVAGANDNAAARGLYDSGIRTGNVGTANTAAARSQLALQKGFQLTAAGAAQKQNAAKQQLGDFLKIAAVKAAENGASLPVDPYSTGAGQGSNVPGTPTMKKTKPKVKR